MAGKFGDPSQDGQRTNTHKRERVLIRWEVYTWLGDRT